MLKKPLKKHLPPSPKQNRILAALPPQDYARMLPDLELIEMPLGWTMSESGDHVNFLHSPTSGIVSLIYTLEDGSSNETALVGNEGMVGISIFMDGESMRSSTEVQSPGEAYRLARKVMKREFALGGSTATRCPAVHAGAYLPDIADGRVQSTSFRGSANVPLAADEHRSNAR